MTCLVLFVFGIVRIDSMTIIRIQAIPGRTVLPFCLVFLVIASIIIPNDQGAGQSECKQQR
ncbi:hypothetical protein RM96_10995 [Cupriavidus sp. IDO]|nr:hypothetical protein RM96_10995 [Cupriavidus sp. IDO]